MNAISTAVASVGATLLKALLQQVEQLQKPWQQMPAREQEVVIFRLREAVEIAVRNAVKRVAANSFPHIPATVESVTFKDGVKAVFQLTKGEDGTHALADATGGQAMIVLANAAEFIEGIERVQADADQGTLDLPEPQEPVVPSESWQELIDSIEKGPPGEEVGEPATPKTMGQQVQELLAKADVHVQLVVTETWSEQECTVAAYWAIEVAKNPDTAPARPHWLPLPSAIAEGHTRVFQSPTALSAYIDVPAEIYAKVWNANNGATYDDYVRAVEDASGDDQERAA